MTSVTPINLDSLVALKVSIDGTNRRFKLPLRDCGAAVFPDKLRSLLALRADDAVVFKRYSDSAGDYVTLDRNNTAVYKQLFRAAKAKLKLRIKATRVKSAASDGAASDDASQPPALVSVDAVTNAAESAADATITPTTTTESSANASNTPVKTETSISVPVPVPGSFPAPPLHPVEAPAATVNDSLPLLPADESALSHAITSDVNNQYDTIDALVPYCAKPQEEATAEPSSLASIDSTAAAKSNHLDVQPTPSQKATGDDQNDSVKTESIVDEHAGSSGPSAANPRTRRDGSMEYFRIDCNNCERPVDDDHYHCSICDNGDFDLCPHCVARGATCGVDGHWLIKRSVNNGKIISSTTEIVSKSDEEPAKVEPERKLTYRPCRVRARVHDRAVSPVRLGSGLGPEIISTATGSKPSMIEHDPTRTCNSCIRECPIAEMVTCVDCDDYDLCLPCNFANKHGHNPLHTFEPVIKDAVLDEVSAALAAPGRNVRHFALCDGCDKVIFGIRNKCLECPDFDLCPTCFKSVAEIHPTHKFVPITGPVNLAVSTGSAPIHFGITCDGILCKDKPFKSYIHGIRYKCAVCYDTDFCANCEASPLNHHNRTHPLIKFKTPVRNVSVTTVNEKVGDAEPTFLGDFYPKFQSKSTETVPAAGSSNAATQVQTIAELKPSTPLSNIDQPLEDLSNIQTAHIVRREGWRERMERMEKKFFSDLEEARKAAERASKLPAPPTIATAADEDEGNASLTTSREVTRMDEVRAAAIASPPVFYPNSEIRPSLMAVFVRDIVRDHTKVAPNKSFTQVWTLYNPGPKPWPAGCSVRYVGGDNMLDVDNNHVSSTSDVQEATSSNVTTDLVRVDEFYDFHISMRAPSREGKSISFWRLKTADGVPFGHKLWCDVDVVSESSPIAVQQEEAEHVESTSQISVQPKVEDEDETEVVVKQEEQEPVIKTESQLLFPKLEKESPVSSTHISAMATEAFSEVTAPVSTESDSSLAGDEYEEGTEWDDGETDEGFHTEDEYDVIDASDREDVFKDARAK